jgi:hypothetical protein
VVPFPARLGAGVWVVIGGAAILIITSVALSLRAPERIEPSLRSPS